MLRTALQDGGSAYRGSLVLATDRGPGFVPLINFTAESGDFKIEAGSLGGLASSISLSGGSGLSGTNFHLKLFVDLDGKRLSASVTGDATASTGLLTYTGTFNPGYIALTANGTYPSFGATWDNISIVPEPVTSSMAIVGGLGLLSLRRRCTGR